MMIGVAFGHSVEQSVGRAADGATPFICVRVMGRRSGRRTGASHDSSRFTPVLFATIRPARTSNAVSIRLVDFPLKSTSKRLSTRTRNVERKLKWQACPFSLMHSLLLGFQGFPLVSLKIRFFGF